MQYNTSLADGSRYLVALGANLPSQVGTPLETLESAVKLLARNGFQVEKKSRWFSTPAVPAGSGPEFVNGAVAIRSTSRPGGVLEKLHQIEHQLGRSRDLRWEPRICDLDLLACDDSVLPDVVQVRAWMDIGAKVKQAKAPDQLILPHPRMHERAFVLLPLSDVAPDWAHPLTGRTVMEMLKELPASDLADIRPL